VERSWLGKDLSVSDTPGRSQRLASQLGITTILDLLEKAKILDRDNRGNRLLAASENDAFASVHALEGAGKAGWFLGGDPDMFSSSAATWPRLYADGLIPCAGIVSL